MDDYKPPAIKAKWQPGDERPPSRLRDTAPPRKSLPQIKVDAFTDRCLMCFHWGWDVFESGAPIWSTCKHGDHDDFGVGDRRVECSRVAERYQGEKCPKFWPVILRAPVRLLFRGIRRRLS